MSDAPGRARELCAQFGRALPGGPDRSGTSGDGSLAHRVLCHGFMKRVLVLVVSAGCSVGLGRGSGSGTAASMEAPREGHTRYDAGWIAPDRIRSLIGKPIGEAKRLLLSWGQTGDIDVSEGAYGTCALGVVCEVIGVDAEHLAAKIDPTNRISLGAKASPSARRSCRRSE